MIRSKALLLCLVLVMLNITALAQEKKVEVSGHLGYTASSGFDVDPVILNGRVVDNIGVNSGLSFGFQGDYVVSENAAVGFLFARQSSELTATGFDTTGVFGDKVNITDMPIYNFLFVGTYNFGEENAKLRPYFLGGAGWTKYSPGTLSGVLPNGTTLAVDLDSKSKFALTFGGGVKFFMNPSIGFKASARWTPTYIGSTPEGIFCTPFYCGVAENLKWSNQGEFSGGVIFRF